MLTQSGRLQEELRLVSFTCYLSHVIAFKRIKSNIKGVEKPSVVKVNEAKVKKAETTKHLMPLKRVTALIKVYRETKSMIVATKMTLDDHALVVKSRFL